eukprot:gnl/Hemi2/3371_TR1175_c0_g1_i1.p1 gnl/Hemi2/3371_TR1175_c0_g1~~gnl/Hemi2/3371_TR1175_c0_g1_i1.p1  ORF type:complete len:244 (+),score=82.01 gnl/Hemi2/3371_TR1175_c0_g1_i1:93-824(+)
MLNNQVAPAPSCGQSPFEHPQYQLSEDGLELVPIDQQAVIDEESKSYNPLIFIKLVHLRYCAQEGGAKAHRALSNINGTLGVVAALIAALIFASTDAPPSCSTALDNCNNTSNYVALFSSAASVALVCSICTIIFVIICENQAAYLREHELFSFIHQNSVLLMCLPAVLSVAALAAILIAFTVRVWIQYPAPAFWVLVGMLALLAPLCIFALASSSYFTKRTRQARQPAVVGGQKESHHGKEC